jgi:nicotinamidase-related amidase
LDPTSTSEDLGKKEALVIVDMQNANVGRFCIPLIPKIRLLIEKARKKGAISLRL